MFSSTVGRLSSSRSADRPDGSPIIAVPPPTTTTGVPPARCRWIRPKIGTRLPMCSDGPVGSKPL